MPEPESRCGLHGRRPRPEAPAGGLINRTRPSASHRHTQQARPQAQAARPDRRPNPASAALTAHTRRQHQQTTAAAAAADDKHQAVSSSGKLWVASTSAHGGQAPVIEGITIQMVPALRRHAPAPSPATVPASAPAQAPTPAPASAAVPGSSVSSAPQLSSTTRQFSSSLAIPLAPQLSSKFKGAPNIGAALHDHDHETVPRARSHDGYTQAQATGPPAGLGRRPGRTPGRRLRPQAKRMPMPNQALAQIGARPRAQAVEQAVGQATGPGRRPRP